MQKKCFYVSIYLSLCLYLSLSVSICLYLSLSVSICLYLSLSVSICLYLSICLSLWSLSLSFSICLYVPIYLSHLSIFFLFIFRIHKICVTCVRRPCNIVSTESNGNYKYCRWSHHQCNPRPKNQCLTKKNRATCCQEIFFLRQIFHVWRSR